MGEQAGQTFDRKFFLSYREKDEGASLILGNLSLRLEEMYGKGQVFYDHLGLQAGKKWDPEIRRHLKEADAVIVVIADDARWLGVTANGPRRIDQGDDDWVYWEVKTALELVDETEQLDLEDPNQERKRKWVFPLLVGKDTPVPKRENLPPGLAKLAEIQCYHLSGRDHRYGDNRDRDLVWRIQGFCRYIGSVMPLPATRVGLMNRLVEPIEDLSFPAMIQAAENQEIPLVRL